LRKTGLAEEGNGRGFSRTDKKPKEKGGVYVLKRKTLKGVRIPCSRGDHGGGGGRENRNSYQPTREKLKAARERKGVVTLQNVMTI